MDQAGRGMNRSLAHLYSNFSDLTDYFRVAD